MTKILRVFLTTASITGLSSALFVERAQAELSCTDVAKALLSKATGLPTSEAGWIIGVLTPETNVAPPSVDQRTQTSPSFAKINANDLSAHDKDLVKAQQWMQSSVPLSPDNQKIIGLMQKEHDNIQKELSQRDLENIPTNQSPNEFFEGVLRSQSDAKDHPQTYNRNPWPVGGGAPPTRTTSPGNSEGTEHPPGSGGGNCGPAGMEVRCTIEGRH